MRAVNLLALTAWKQLSGVRALYVDVHCHLTAKAFAGKEQEIMDRISAAEIQYCIVNGVDKNDNRAVLELCQRHDGLLPALGIYPIDAANAVLTPDMMHNSQPVPEKFDADSEIAFIDEVAASGALVAIGECGLDRYHVDSPLAMQEQERVLRGLCAVAKKHDLPLILHSRKSELRVNSFLQEEGVVKAIFHCYCGKIKLAKRIAEAGYYLSIPSAVERIESFQMLANTVPISSILSETDSPYMGPDKGEVNDPSTIPSRGVAAIAAARGEGVQGTAEQIRMNFQKLFEV
ncbi:unnamed protein product [Chrysoparadoxa australica]